MQFCEPHYFFRRGVACETTVFMLCICSKVLQAKMGRANFMEFRGEHGDFRELLEATERSVWCGEECDQDNVTLIHPMVLQYTQCSNHRGTTL